MGHIDKIAKPSAPVPGYSAIRKQLLEGLDGALDALTQFARANEAALTKDQLSQFNNMTPAGPADAHSYKSDATKFDGARERMGERIAQGQIILRNAKSVIKDCDLLYNLTRRNNGERIHQFDQLMQDYVDLWRVQEPGQTIIPRDFDSVVQRLGFTVKHENIAPSETLLSDLELTHHSMPSGGLTSDKLKNALSQLNTILIADRDQLMGQGR